jgi:hypothetical protein
VQQALKRLARRIICRQESRVVVEPAPDLGRGVWAAGRGTGTVIRAALGLADEGRHARAAEGRAGAIVLALAGLAPWAALGGQESDWGGQAVALA